MSKCSHLVHLENKLGADLEEARRLVESGRRDAIEQLEANRGRLGSLYRKAGRAIERAAHGANEDLRLVRQRLVELHLLLDEEELDDLAVLEHFRDRVVEAIDLAEGDLESLKQHGDAWSSQEVEIRDAWERLSRRLALVRIHLVMEMATAVAEFGAMRSELIREHEAPRPRRSPLLIYPDPYHPSPHRRPGGRDDAMN